MRAWRLVKRKFAASAFDGEGAMQSAGRWNSLGVRVVYASEALSLALLEVLVRHEKAGLLKAFSSFEIRFDDALMVDVSPTALPEDWRDTPEPVALRRVGDEWIRSKRSAVLRVPSAIVPIESNFLINPEHPDFARLDIMPETPFEIDSRLAPEGPAGSRTPFTVIEGRPRRRRIDEPLDVRPETDSRRLP